MKHCTLVFLFIFSVQTFSFAQPDPCDTGSEAACECETAELLCSINELDGYSFSMSEFEHPEDGPDPLCGSGVPNNPTWFSFIAWCEELVITVSLSNCTQPSFSIGAQVGIYESCNYEEVACENDCGNEDDKVLDLDGLVIGEVYHFLIDGCAGSACDVDITVDGMCTEEIEDWTDGISGATEACSGDAIDYVTDELDGATSYHWYIDGSEDSVTDDPENTITWGSEGTYELCVDASNECVDVSEDPEQYCVTVTVLEPDAGTITATPNPLCPGETSDFEVTGFNEDPGIEEVIIVVDPNGEVLEVITGGSTGDVTYDECGDVTIYSLNYADFETIDIPSVGGTYSGTDCTDLCCDEESLVISFEDTEDPEFTNPPGDLTLVCFDEVPPMEDLPVTDNCAPDDIVSGTETGSADLCDGGVIEREWTFADDCGNEITHVQTITIDPIEMPEYINPPGDEEIICSGTIPPPVDLMYTNNGVGGCLIEGLVTPTVTGMFDICGSTITYEWDFTDMCGNNLNHVQTIEILPAEEPEFLNPPADVVIDCDGTIPDPIDLEYSNGDSGVCLDEGLISPTVNGSFDICGTIITYEWDYTDACGVNINHVQTIEILPALEASFINPPPDLTLSCDEFNAYTFEDLDYTNSQASPCEIMGTESPVISDNTNTCGGTVEALYEFEDDCGRIIEHLQTITVDPPPPADFLSMPLDITVNCDEIPAPADPLDYSNGDAGVCLIEGSADPIIEEDLDECGGTITNTWEYTDDCNRTIEYVQVITVEPAPEPEFESFPADMDLTCDEFTEFEPEVLSYTNNESGVCLIEGEVEPSSTGVITECGGSILYEWEYSDLCGRTITHSQIVNVSPAPQAEFVSSPQDMTLDCSEASDELPFLEYDNEESGECRIQGFVEAIPSGVVDECGGMLELTWTFTDNCGRQINETQTLTYLPADEPEFIDPPEDMEIDCDEDVPDPEVLEYSNELDAPCEIAGEVEAEVSVDENIYTYTWTFINLCTDNEIEHVQVIEKKLPVEFEEDEFEFQICVGNEFDLSTIVPFDINGTDPEITYHDELPADGSNEIDPVITLEDDGTEYYIVGTNDFGCFDVAVVTGIADELSQAGEDIVDEFCISEELLDLYSYLEFPADLDGEFTLIDGPDDLDFAFADEINVSNAEPGIYVFRYFVESDNSCPSDESEMTIELLPPVEIDLISIACNPDGQTYTITISNDNFDIDISDGVIVSQTSDEIVIDNIPISQDIEIEAENTSTRCEAEFIFLHPDCSCPTVEAPQIVSNLQICEGEPIPLLEVTVAPEVIANWYDAPIGGNLLQANSLTYQASNNQPGIYTFYVEGESTLQPGCVSATRTPIQLEIIPSPSTSDIILDLCDDSETGLVSILLSDIEDVLFSGLTGLTATYYLTLDDLNNQVNPIAFPFTNTEMGSQTIYYEVSNSANCLSTGTVTLLIHNIPVINPLFGDETCLGENDGFIDFDVVADNPPFDIIFESDTLSTNIVQNLGQGVYNFEVVDSLGCRSSSQVSINAGIELVIESLEVICQDNNTSTDATDDFYFVTFSVVNTNATPGDFNLTISPQNISDTYSYGELHTIEIPADGSETEFIINDVLLNCSLSQNIGELTSCSSDCEIILNSLEYLCLDNGTPLDPSDDFYEFMINASAINGNPNNNYNVLIDNVLSHSFDYDVTETFTVPANNMSVSIRLVDSQLNNCFISEITDVLTPCSDACLIEATLVNVICSDNGTLSDENDDTFNYTILVESTNASDSFTIIGNLETYAYNEEITFENILISNGGFDLEFQDSDDNTCVTILNITPPLPCSQPCTIELSDLSISDCNDNGTNMDSNDDFYEVSFIITSTDGDVSNVLVTDDSGIEYGPFNYDQIINIGPLVANGQDITLTITDVVNGTCFLEQVVSQNSCSEAQCSLTLDLISVTCNDNNTPATNDDDIYSIEFSISGINVSDNGFITSLMTNGNYDEVILIENLNISDGNFLFEVMDSDNTDCSTSIEIIPPAPCSQPCSIDLAYIDILDCNDNATNTDNEDDFYSVAFNVNVLDGITSMYLITDDMGNEYGPFNYNEDIELGPFSADGNNITLSFSDLNNTSCFLEQVISQEACSNACQIEAQLISIACDNNSTDGDNDDDIFTAEILVTGINNGLEFTVDPLSIMGTYNTNLLLGPFSIQDGTQNLTIYDNDSGMIDCMTSISINPPAPCSNPCDIELGQLEIFDCNDNGTGNIVEDDFYSISFEVNGILGQGSEFELLDNSGNTYGPFEYNTLVTIDNLSADNQQITFSVIDPSNGSCTLEFSSQSQSCSGCNQTISILANNTNLDCNQQEIELEIEPISADIDVINWSGSNNFSSDAPIINISDPGIYFVEVIYLDGCIANDEIEITITDDTPVANAGEDGIINCDVQSYVLDASLSILTNNTLIEWLDASGNVISNELTFEVEEAGIYSLVLTDTNTFCVSNIDEVEVTIYDNTPSAIIFADPGNVFDCFIESIDLSTEEEENVIYNWIVNNQLIEDVVVTITDISDVSLIALDTLSQCETETTIEIEDLTSFPIISLNDFSSIGCEGEEACIEVTTLQTTEPYEYRWYDENGNLILENESILCITTPGTYTIELTDTVNGCVNESSFEIEPAIIPSITLQNEITLSIGDNFQLNPVISLGSNEIMSIDWGGSAVLSCTDCIAPFILEFEDNDIITLTVVSIDGCEETVETRISIIEEIERPKYYIPNVFSSTYDNQFTIYTSEEIEIIENLYIYDRWGELIFTNQNFAPNEPASGWDGTFNNRLVEQGVYVYMFKFSVNGREEIVAGDVTFIR